MTEYYRTCPCGATHTGVSGSNNFEREHDGAHAERVIEMQNKPQVINPYTYPFTSPTIVGDRWSYPMVTCQMAGDHARVEQS